MSDNRCQYCGGSPCKDPDDTGHCFQMSATTSSDAKVRGCEKHKGNPLLGACYDCRRQEQRTYTSSDNSTRRVLLSPRQYADELDRLCREIDNIKVRAYELGQKELHDMALAALEKAQ